MLAKCAHFTGDFRSFTHGSQEHFSFLGNESARACIGGNFLSSLGMVPQSVEEMGFLLLHNRSAAGGKKGAALQLSPIPKE